MKFSTSPLLMAAAAAATVLIATPTTTVSAALLYDSPTSEELNDEYPALESTRAGNGKILCPYLRMIERSGRIDADADGNDVLKSHKLKKATEAFGCDTTTACGPVIDVVSAGQAVTADRSSILALFNPFRRQQVELERLYEAPPISHDCGLTFEPGAEGGAMGVSEDRLASTLAAMEAKANDDGQLVYDDIRAVKLDICAQEGVNVSAGGIVETQLLFSYLGGKDRGFVDYSDVERFLVVDNKLPMVKAEKQVTAAIIVIN